MLPRRPQSVLFITFLVLIVVSSGAGELFLYMFSGKSLRRMGRRFPDLYSCSYFTTSREIWTNITLPLKTHREKQTGMQEVRQMRQSRFHKVALDMCWRTGLLESGKR